MNILIFGGLLVIVVVGSVGLIMLGMDEVRVEKQRETQSAAPPMPTDESKAPQASEVALPTDTVPSPMPGIPTSLPYKNLHTTRQPTSSLHKNELLPMSQSSQPSEPISHEEEATAILSNELPAIIGELRLLAQKASEMDQRLSQLSDLLERRQQPQNGVTARSPMPKIEERE